MTTDFLSSKTASSIDSPRMREAGKDLLSLALMDARNHTLYLFALYERHLAASNYQVPKLEHLNPPLWELGHVGWFQEWWLGRNMQRAQGNHCEPHHTRLASIEPHADRWYDSSRVAHGTRWGLDLPDLAATKNYLLETLEQSLELRGPGVHGQHPGSQAGAAHAERFHAQRVRRAGSHLHAGHALDFGQRSPRIYF